MAIAWSSFDFELSEYSKLRAAGEVSFIGSDPMQEVHTGSR